MNTDERRAFALAIGAIIALAGVTVMQNALSASWGIMEMFGNVFRLIGGGFITMIGTIIFLSGISDKTTEVVSDLLGHIWDRFLEALSK